MSARRRPHAGGWFDRPGLVLGGMAVLAVIGWVLFTASASLQELSLGVVVVALTLLFCRAVLRTQRLSLAMELRDLLLARFLPGSILKDSWKLTVVLWRDLVGGQPAASLYMTCGFRTSRHNPLLMGRSALAIAYATMSPNMVVIGIDPAQSLMLYHQLVPEPVSPFLEQLGARGIAGAAKTARPEERP